MTRSNSAGVISCPQCGQVVLSDASTFARSIFLRAGIQGFYNEALSSIGRAIDKRSSFLKANRVQRFVQ